MVIDQNLVCLDINGNKEDVINQLSQLAYDKGKINNLTSYKEAVFKREKEFSTALGYNVAIPHGQSEGVNEPFIVFGRCKETMLWDENKVKMVFMIGVPMKNREKTHMKILANISRKLLNEDFRKSLLDAQDNKEVFEILLEISI